MQGRGLGGLRARVGYHLTPLPDPLLSRRHPGQSRQCPTLINRSRHTALPPALPGGILRLLRLLAQQMPRDQRPEAEPLTDGPMAGGSGELSSVIPLLSHTHTHSTPDTRLMGVPPLRLILRHRLAGHPTIQLSSDTTYLENVRSCKGRAHSQRPSSSPAWPLHCCSLWSVKRP